ncbi:MAG: glycine cleavage system protein GcvH [Chloroflexi bacterium]|nr:glycine cleavage system protein GcvH [Chloroflexota bacterium]
MAYNVPDDLRYAESDEWIKVEGDEATVGITDYAQDHLSDVVYVELPDVGATFAKGESFGVVESVKAAADLNIPVGGEVIAINEALEDEPEKVNEAPYEAWMIRIKLNDASELDALMDAEAYTTYSNDRDD